MIIIKLPRCIGLCRQNQSQFTTIKPQHRVLSNMAQQLFRDRRRQLLKRWHDCLCHKHQMISQWAVLLWYKVGDQIQIRFQINQQTSLANPNYYVFQCLLNISSNNKSQFQHQTAIMLRKKHSEINIKVSLKPYSPLRNKSTSRSPLPQRPQDRNLSPMKNHNHTPKSRPRHHFAPEHQYDPSNNCQNTFEAQLQSLASGLTSRYDSKPCTIHHYEGYKASFTRQEASQSSLGIFSKGMPAERTFKESKKLFTKCISVMNSAKRRNEGESSTLTTTQGPYSKIATEVKQKSHQNATSFKALKIQMIESVLPEDKNTSEKKLLKVQNRFIDLAPVKCRQATVEQVQVNDFNTEENYQPIQLINQSFSNAGGSELAQRAKVMESICVSEASDYTDFDMLIQRVTVVPSKSRKPLQASVRASSESIESQFHLQFVP